ncbi:hypothetical protein Tco_0222347 [Tanacetum coccineum]
MRTFVKNQSSTIYTTEWTMKHVKSFSNAQLKAEFDKIRTAAADLQSQNLRRSLKRPGADLEHAIPSTKATQEECLSPSTTHHTKQTASSTKKVGTSRGIILVEKGVQSVYMSESKMFSIQLLMMIHPLICMVLLTGNYCPTGFSWVNVIYRKDNSRKCFSRLREILHLVTRIDLMIIYGRVMTFYQDKEATGVGLVLWGDLKVLIDSPEVNDVEMVVQSAPWSNPFWTQELSSPQATVKCCGDPVAVYLSMLSFLMLLQCSEVCFWRWFQDVAVQSSVPAGSVVPTGKDSSIVSTGSTKVIPAGNTILVLMKNYVELKCLGYVLPQELKCWFNLEWPHYNKHNMGKTVGELHAMLIEYEKGLPKKAETPQVMMIKGGKIQKSNKKSLKAKGKGKANGKGNDKQVYIPKSKNPKPSVKEHPAKDDTCHHYKEVGHCKRICPAYLDELIKKKKQVGTASSSDIFTIELFAFPNKS